MFAFFSSKLGCIGSLVVSPNDMLILMLVIRDAVADVSAVLDTIIVDEGPAGLSAALLLGRCLSNVVVCEAGHPRDQPAARSRGPSEAERDYDKVQSKAADATLKRIAGRRAAAHQSPSASLGE